MRIVDLSAEEQAALYGGRGPKKREGVPMPGEIIIRSVVDGRLVIVTPPRPRRSSHGQRPCSA